MPVLLLLGLGVFAPAAHAGDCPSPVTEDQLAATLDQAEGAWAAADESAFLLHMEEAHLQLPCLGARVAPGLAARTHRDSGLWLYASGHKDMAGQAFASARRVEAGHALPPGLAPPAHPVRQLFEASTPDTAREAVPAPTTGQLVFDGAPGERPVGGPTIAQLEDAAGAVRWTRYLRPGQDLPPYDAVAPVATVTPPTAPPPTAPTPAGPAARPAHALGWTLVAGAGVLGLGSGVAALVARNTRSTFETDPPGTRGAVDDLVQKNHAASTASAVLLGAAGAAGATAVFVW